jgi:hypothetical protein
MRSGTFSGTESGLVSEVCGDRGSHHSASRRAVRTGIVLGVHSPVKRLSASETASDLSHIRRHPKSLCGILSQLDLTAEDRSVAIVVGG